MTVQVGQRGEVIAANLRNIGYRLQKDMSSPVVSSSE